MVSDPELLLIRGPQAGRTFPLAQHSITLGRDPRNDVVIDHPQVSRRHARITRQSNVWVIEDLESTNGTFVNGTRLTEPRALTQGDTVELSEAVALTYRRDAIALDEARQPVSRSSAGAHRDQASPRRAQVPEPPPTFIGPPSPARTPPPERNSPQGQIWFLVGAGCFVLFLAAACVAVFVLDYFGLLPAFFYEPFRWLGLI